MTYFKPCIGSSRGSSNSFGARSNAAKFRLGENAAIKSGNFLHFLSKYVAIVTRIFLSVKINTTSSTVVSVVNPSRNSSILKDSAVMLNILNGEAWSFEFDINLKIDNKSSSAHDFGAHTPK